MPNWTEEIKKKIVELSSSKKTIRQIAEETGISKSSIGLFLKSSKKPEEINAATTIEMIGDKEAANFLKSLGEDKNEEKPSSAFVDSLIDGIEVIPTQPNTKKTRAKKVKMDLPIVRRERPYVAPEDPVKKADIVGKITFNVNTFESLLGDVIRGDKDGFLKGLDKMSQNTLENTLRTIETTRSVKNIANQFMHFFTMGSTAVEMGTQQFLGMQTQGFTQMMLQTQSDEIRLIMTELAMEQKDKFQKVQRPEVRLAMIVTTSLIAVNTQNKLASLRQQRMGQNKPPENKIIPEDKVKDYKDL